MKNIVLAAVAATLVSTAAMAMPTDSAGLKELAYTGSGDLMAKEGRGTSIHAWPSNQAWVAAAEATLAEQEFLAPHWLETFDNKVFIMVAPHLKVNGEVVKGAGPEDNFIVVDKMGTKATRYDYSDTYPPAPVVGNYIDDGKCTMSELLGGLLGSSLSLAHFPRNQEDGQSTSNALAQSVQDPACMS